MEIAVSAASSTTMSLLPFLGAMGAATMFVGLAILFGVWIPQLWRRRSSIEGTPAESLDLDAEAPTGRFRPDFDDTLT
jgi:hypothetical protein